MGVGVCVCVAPGREVCVCGGGGVPGREGGVCVCVFVYSSWERGMSVCVCVVPGREEGVCIGGKGVCVCV